MDQRSPLGPLPMKPESERNAAKNIHNDIMVVYGESEPVFQVGGVDIAMKCSTQTRVSHTEISRGFI